MDSFSNRTEAGEKLAEELKKNARHWVNALVLGLPRGGVPVAAPVARGLDAELDVLTVRKVGVPGQPELAMGALASGGIVVRNKRVIYSVGVDDATFEAEAAKEREELREREARFREDRPRPVIRGRTVILVDDGIATGSTMQAAVRAVRQEKPVEVVVAVPVGSSDSLDMLEHEADHVICLMKPSFFAAVGQFYRDFPQTSNDEVKTLLKEAWDKES